MNFYFKKSLYPEANRPNTIKLEPVANSFLYNFGGSSLHNMMTKTLIQIMCPGYSRVAWPFL
jgi:hypothetical protein